MASVGGPQQLGGPGQWPVWTVVNTALLRIFAQTSYFSVFLETRIIDLHFIADTMGLSSFIFFLVNSVQRFVSDRVRFGHSRSYKVIDFGTN